MQRTWATVVTTAFVTVPATVSCGIPWLLTRWSTPHAWDTPALLPVRAAGIALIVLALPSLLRAIVRFVVEGRGTPVPVAPTEHLVVGGPYRRVRNPMYVAVLSIILGQVLLFLRPWLVPYGLAVWLFFFCYVRLAEEPKLRGVYGEQYDAYRAAVPAWRPRLRPWQAPAGAGSGGEGQAAPGAPVLLPRAVPRGER